MHLEKEEDVLRKRISDALNELPKEHRKVGRKLIENSINFGRVQVQIMNRDIADIPSSKLDDYVVIHEDSLDGG